MRIILASQSPRRKELMSQMGIDFEVIPSQCKEIVDDKIALDQMALSFASQKAQEIYDKTTGDRLVIGCDTTVLMNGKIYGKPHSDKEAFDILKSYCNTCNLVITGLCVLVQNGEIETKYTANETSKVYVGDMSDEEINEYIKTGEPFDKAGAYALQGKYNIFVERVEGNVSSVVGLPTNKLLEIFRQENIKLFEK